MIKKIRYLWPLAVLATVLLAMAGGTYAWFSNNASLATLLEIHPPDSITITPVDDHGTGLGALDLEYREGGDDQKDPEAGTITVRRPVCIKSTSPVHQLEVVHTTNLNQLSFKIYPATQNEGKDGFSYNSSIALTGKAINPREDNDQLAKAENLNNYKAGNIVEDHAYPLYWLANSCGDSSYAQGSFTEVSSERTEEYDAAKQCDTYYYTTYYVLEISWKETTKDTDLFYILVQNIDADLSEGGGNS